MPHGCADLRRQMKQRGLAGVLLNHLADVRYLCGFTGSNAFLAVTPNRAAMFTDGRYIAQARQETKAARVMIAVKSARDEACQWMAASGAAHCAFNPQTTTVAELAYYRKALPAGHRGFFQPLTEPLAATLRLIKDEDELRLMKQAAQLGADLFHELLPQLHPGHGGDGGCRAARTQRAVPWGGGYVV